MAGNTDPSDSEALFNIQAHSGSGDAVVIVTGRGQRRLRCRGIVPAPSHVLPDARRRMPPSCRPRDVAHLTRLRRYVHDVQWDILRRSRNIPQTSPSVGESILRPIVLVQRSTSLRATTALKSERRS